MPTPIKLALSGSGTRLYAHIGAAARLLDLGFVVEEAIGTSGGAIVAAAVCAGFSANDLRALALDCPPQAIIRARSAFQMATQGLGGARAFCSTEPVLRRLRAILPESFSELQVPCHVATTNWTRCGKPVIWQSGDLPLTVVASMALPIFDMVPIAGMLVEEKSTGILYGLNAREPNSEDKQLKPGVDQAIPPRGVVSIVPELYEDGGVAGNFWVDFKQWRSQSGAPVLGLRAKGKNDPKIRKPPKTKLERIAATLGDLIDTTDREKIEDVPSAKVCYVRSQYSGFDFSFSQEEITHMMREGSESVDEFLRNNPF